MLRNVMRILPACLMVLSVALQGCVAMQMYPGPMRPDDEIAKIVPKIGVYGVAGKEIAVVSFDGGVVGEPYAVLEVLPGKHLVGVRYEGTVGSVTMSNGVPCFVVISAEAGRHYQVNGEYLLGERAWHCWYQDETTGVRRRGVFLQGALPDREQLPTLMDAIETEIARSPNPSTSATWMTWRTAFGPVVVPPPAE
jgi:hypothetical protein